MKTLSPPEYGAMKTLIYDKVKSYLFAGSYDSGSIYVFEVGKPGHEKITKQIAMLKNK
jgi:6-phosphogluconolactonase (cycloisomerase 2 family)